MKKLTLLFCFTFFVSTLMLFSFMPTSYALASSELKEKQSITLNYNKSTWKLDLRKYEIHSDIHTIENAGSKFNRHGDILSKLKSISEMLKYGMNYSGAFEFIMPKINNDIDKNINKINRPVKDATIKFNPKYEKFNITKEVTGYHIDKEKLFIEIYDLLSRNNEIKINLKPIVIKPKYYSEDFKKATNKRESYTTNFASSNEARRHNIKLAASKFNGKTLMPGEVLSFNLATGKRNKQTGYKEANIILNGIYISGEAGGVCQVSTALFNAAVLNGLDILEVRSHSLPPNYTKKGEDAMVSENISDLKIRNNFSTPVSIKTNVSGDNLTVTFYGEKPDGTSFDLETVILEELPIPKKEIIKDINNKYAEHFTGEITAYQARKPLIGYKTETYILKYKNGELISRKKLRKDFYKPQGELIILKP